jgi:hypothetical protein
VVQVVQEKSGQIVYTLRISGRVFSPKVFGPGEYTVRVGKSTGPQMKALYHLRPAAKGSATISVIF